MDFDEVCRPVYSVKYVQPVDGGEVHLLLPASPLRVRQGAPPGITIMPAQLIILCFNLLTVSVPVLGT